MGESEWRLEPEEEAEVPEIIIVSEERSFGKEREVPGEEGEEVKKSEKESDSSGITRNAGTRKRSKECGAGSSGREDFCTKCGQCSEESDVSL